MRRIGVLTSGGDSPGMNAAVMAVAKAARYYGLSLIGIKRGYNGTLCKSNRIEDDMMELDLDTILDIADQPGTYLRTARCLDFLRPEMRAHAVNNIHEMGIEGIVVIGGDGSYHGAMELCELGVPCVGIPGTIDNDLAYTEMTLGYDTAINSCVDDIRAIRATSRSHDRPAVVEVMGRHCGDIALKAAAGSGAEICIVPEVPWSIQEVADRLSHQIGIGNLRATVVVAEGAWDAMQPFEWQRYLKENGARVHDDGTAGLHVAFQLVDFLLHILDRVDVGRAAAEDDAFLDCRSRCVQRVFHAVLRFLHLGFRRRADADDRNTARQLRQAFL